MLLVNIQKKLQSLLLDVHFKADGEIVVLFGPSGAGKTTILNCIAGLIHPDSGQIKLNKRNLYNGKQKPMPIAKRHIGYLFQDYALFPHMTVEKNIRYGMKDEQLLHHLAELMGIKHLFGSYPHQISGGEKQRVALVRTLVTKPKALLLDEPFSSLDIHTKLACQDELIRLHESWNIPIVLVTHDIEEAEKLGDLILRIDNGQLFCPQ
ncbi:molybdate transport system ATP-binding protein [Lentibacillus halodurans]|uniref:Molybdate transport system ATP-binding protein n=1 Tax=Lentibacillus halodurans TaxID=237679 RepID=A0A1I0ZWU4_9BACI|nr:ATP-binding cassette domain-containing protein [Lentibacillus halodurans]SFB30017.1 molybdate transport system ATP-binding protein [Lentibacillus halodurans]